ncbi:MAG: bifunctional phosphoribosyl-AMP cyclohydrolase/phosphoribosyl-ATP diphosphatase HisIE [Firmicutes bacterium]|nr:bifunctional phosphoribosyl-AMP cyclohydrolase/phosphoribosyl-ATP diphosphatase HisIE [Alicyclobacillaceae bacterium]MCL6496590.1 bifunctional phosphoribosyl-AMP cyclohydrolase/phosphoribosyl-ATP diphosphatase HisIE [Bacillota bacterium]
MAHLVEEGVVLYPVTVQDAGTGRILMSAFADEAALTLTRTTGLAHFYSRSRRRLWKKGETSGHLLPVEAVIADCDADSYLYLARPIHPVCHRNTPSCFDDAPSFGVLERLEHWVRERSEGPPDPTSYTQRLLNAPPDRLLKKVGEEATEVILAALAPDAAQELVWECADLLYHVAVVLYRAGVSVGAVAKELERRHHPVPPESRERPTTG